VPDHLIGDPTRLRQILVNLTDNAIKFTERGEVVVSVSSQSRSEAESELHFSVSDTGIGIPQEKQAAIFAAFAQADGSTTRTYGGTGLGLSIASQLIQKMDGKIWIESEVGAGTTFHFTTRLGLRAAPLPAVKHAELQDLQGLRALVVDDNAVNRRMLNAMLMNWRMKPTAVESGASALKEMARAVEANAAYEVVLLDAMMPEMDGFALAEKINAQPALADATVMMLSSAMPAGTAERCSALGIAGWLSKPITQSELLDAILIAVNRDAGDGSKGTADPQIAERSAPSSGLRILVAEDNPVNRAVATGILEKQGHLLVHAATGREAVEAFSDGAFDLILMDVQMPEMDGFEATRRIRGLEETTGGHITIAAMTAHAMAGDRDRCLAAGMDDYVSKPLRKEDLLRVLEGATVARKQDEKKARFLYTREELLSECDGDEDLLSELVSIFHDNTPQIVRAIGMAVEKHDAPALAAQAHKLLSSLGTFGAGRARALALRLEKQARENDFDGAKERFTELERETHKIHAALAGYGTDVALA
jgi:CheY-like chemotaxis protein/HPt (histidine-containing phosphotransfer) domain-containing protein